MRRLPRFRETPNVLALMLSLSGFTALAAPSDEEFESALGDIETVSIATGHPHPLRTAPSVTSVITAEEIRNSGARDLVDVLKLVPGFYIGLTASSRDPVITVRGFSSVFNQNILFMLDGIPQTELVFGNRFTALGKVPLDIIERVEVIRGPGSALYGADAYSAVVNVITQKNVPAQAQLTLSSGSYDTYDLRALAGRRLGNVNVVGAAEYLVTDQYNPFIQEDQQTRLDALLGTRASLAPATVKLGHQGFGAHLNIVGENNSLGLRAAARRNDVGIGSTGTLDPFGGVETTTLEAMFRHRHYIQENLAFEGVMDGSMINYKIDNWHFFPAGALGVFPDGVIFNNEFDQRRLRPRGSLEYTGFKDHYLILGGGGEFGRFKQRSESRNYTVTREGIFPLGSLRDTLSTPALGDKGITRNLVFAYLQDEWTLHPDWILTWGLRYDHYSDFGDTLNPRAVLVWDVRYDLTAKLLYGRGFRAPTLLETRAQQIPAIRANRDLTPEKVDSFDLAFDYRPRLDLLTRFNLFYHETDNQIRYQRTGGLGYVPENVGKQKGRGLEVELQWDMTGYMSFYGFYAYQHNTDETTERDAGYTPHHKLFAMAQYQSRPWLFTVQATYIGERNRVAEDPRPKPETYTFVNVLARYEFSKYLEVSLDIRNIFDEKAQDAAFGTVFPGDIPLPGRTYYFSLIGRY